MRKTVPEGMDMKTIKEPTMPELILFDYGHTLLSEPGWDPMNGLRALMRYSDRSCSDGEIERVYSVGREYYETVMLPTKESGGDIPWKTAAAAVFGICGIRLTVSPDEAEEIYWNAETAGAIMPGADMMLECITRLGIRYGVVSNLTMSGAALSRRIKRLIPGASPEPVVTSSDIGVRKPSPLIFEYALRSCGVSADKVWFCGDNPQADVEGAASVGIYPVWYDSAVECPYRDKERETVPSCDMLRIRDWSELTGLLELLRE